MTTEFLIVMGAKALPDQKFSICTHTEVLVKSTIYSNFGLKSTVSLIIASKFPPIELKPKLLQSDFRRFLRNSILRAKTSYPNSFIFLLFNSVHSDLYHFILSLHSLILRTTYNFLYVFEVNF